MHRGFGQQREEACFQLERQRAIVNRLDAFERDDSRGGEEDVILAKHRNGPTKTVTVADELHLLRFTNMAR
ncbi:hypothetical protein B8W69_07880 [Mycobacterium vulneris]|uniref:Uncharacterized protein n=1 Tax=Mycolicibacterium vulneris TaxID=547163 RepID=A0A1X2L8F2_9MYCO|nr:hypothetical protein B8W69_07880 [Mycolicibacterium vulneris]